MSGIYTRTGDKGTTGLYGGSRISKDSLRVCCYGTVDEANGTMGAAYAFLEDDDMRAFMHNLQEKMFVLGAELASDDNGKKLLSQKIEKSDIEFLERNIDIFVEETGKMKSFVIPGTSKASTFLHMARTVVRRAERNIIELSKQENIREEILKYVNRLSDTLYAMARVEENRSIMKQIKKKVIERLRDKLKKTENEDIEIQNKLSLDICRKMAKSAVIKAAEIGVPIVFSVVDRHGNLVLFERMENSLLASIDISINKAFSSSSLKIPTHEISSLVKPDSELYGLQWTNKGRIVTFGGGYPLKVHGEVIGGIGVSGGTVKEDMIIASHAMRVFGMEK